MNLLKRYLWGGGIVAIVVTYLIIGVGCSSNSAQAGKVLLVGGQVAGTGILWGAGHNDTLRHQCGR